MDEQLENVQEELTPTPDPTGQLAKLKIRIPYDADEFDDNASYEAYLLSLLEDTKDIALNHLYPFLPEFPELPTKYYGWQLRACVELNNTYGFSGFKKYSENGLSFEKANDGMLAVSILNELVPYAGSPERSEVEDSD